MFTHASIDEVRFLISVTFSR